MSTNSIDRPSIYKPVKKSHAMLAIEKIHSTGGQYASTMGAKESFLTPTFDCVDTRRHQSTYSHKRLGYTGNSAYLRYWESLLEATQTYFETSGKLRRAIANITATNANVSFEQAFCALADCSGCVDEAKGKLSDLDYRTDLSSVCDVIEVRSFLRSEEAPSNAATMVETARASSPVKPRTYLTYIQDKASGSCSINESLVAKGPAVEVDAKGKITEFHDGSKRQRKKKAGKDTRTAKEKERDFVAQMYRPSPVSVNRLNNLIDSVMASAEDEPSSVVEAVDDWGSPLKFGRPAARGAIVADKQRPHTNLFTPHQMSMKNYDNAKRLFR